MKPYIMASVAHFIDIQLDWPNIDGGVVKAGTPISLAGRVANDDKAVGILADDAIFVNAANVNRPSAVLIEGVVAIDGAEADSGLTFSDAAIGAMKDITFVDENGAVITPAELPEVSAEDDDKVLGAKNGAWIAVDIPRPLVVAFTITAEEDEGGETVTVLAADHTPEEVLEAMLTVPVAGTVTEGGETSAIGPALYVEDLAPAFGIAADGYYIVTSEGDWHLGMPEASE